MFEALIGVMVFFGLSIVMIGSHRFFHDNGDGRPLAAFADQMSKKAGALRRRAGDFRRRKTDRDYNEHAQIDRLIKNNKLSASHQMTGSDQ